MLKWHFFNIADADALSKSIQSQMLIFFFLAFDTFDVGMFLFFMFDKLNTKNLAFNIFDTNALTFRLL